MNRPFKLYEYPPIINLVKYGERTSYAAKKLPYFKITTREREKQGGVDNYAVCEEPIQKLIELEYEGLVPDQDGKMWPTTIPIRLLSDNPRESFGLFRGFYNGSGVLGCGSQYGEKKALRRWLRYEDFGLPSNASMDAKEALEAREDVSVPYEVDCNAECPYWQMKKKGCDISGTLYFHLDDMLPFSNRLSALMVKGTFAKRILQSSLSLLHKKTGGVLANLPLNLRLHYERKRAMDSNTYSVPMITLEHRGSFDEFMESVSKEIQNRKRRFEIMHMREPSSLDELLIKDVLTEINSRDAIMNSVEEDDFEPLSSENEEKEIPEWVNEFLEEGEFSDNLIRMTLTRFTEEGELNATKFKEFIEGERTRKREQIFDF